MRTASLIGHKEAPWKLVQLRDGRVASASGEADIALWEWRSGDIVGWFKGHEKGPVCNLIEMQNRMVLSGGWDGRVILWDKPGL